MAGFMILAQVKPELLLGGFSNDRETMEIAYLFLRIISLNMIAQGLIFTCSSMFQALGNTKPVLLTSASRVFTYSLPAIWLSTRPGFRMEYVWYLSVAATMLQAGLSLWLLHRELAKRLAPAPQEKALGPESPETIAPLAREPA
jgi:Na+-driven multidrug efflux pump